MMNGNRITFGQTMRLWPALAACALLSACFHFPSIGSPPDPLYDVRSAVVVAGPNASPALQAAVSQRVNAAIAVTTRSEALPQVVLTIRITEGERAQGFQRDRNTAKVDIDASAVGDGSVIAVATFEITTFSSDSAAVDDLMAEDIAARIRSKYALTTPRNDN